MASGRALWPFLKPVSCHWWNRGNWKVSDEQDPMEKIEGSPGHLRDIAPPGGISAVAVQVDLVHRGLSPKNALVAPARSGSRAALQSGCAPGSGILARTGGVESGSTIPILTSATGAPGIHREVAPRRHKGACVASQPTSRQRHWKDERAKPNRDEPQHQDLSWSSELMNHFPRSPRVIWPKMAYPGL